MLNFPSVPGIITDIDGVLYRGDKAILRSPEAIRFLKTPLNIIDRDRFQDIVDRLPFTCLTNCGVSIESHKAENINKALGLEEDHEKVTKHEVIVNFTPLRPIMEEYLDRLVMIVGIGNLEIVAQDIGLRRYITDEEYCTLFPMLVPYRENPYEEEEIEKIKEKVAKRLGIVDLEEFKEPFQIHAIFMLNDPIKWDQRIQIICDLLSTSDGKIAKKIPPIGPEEHIPVYCTCNDIIWMTDFRIPRMTVGCFNQTLKEIYKSIYKRDLKINMYGKPFKVAFEYAEKHLRGMTKLPISKFYMIGDNPKSDIRGGNAAGWTTILVKTGVFHQSEEHQNDPEDPAHYVVEDFMEALKLICELEGIKFNHERLESKFGELEVL